jgi:hypothetical protein
MGVLMRRKAEAANTGGQLLIKPLCGFCVRLKLSRQSVLPSRLTGCDLVNLVTF